MALVALRIGEKEYANIRFDITYKEKERESPSRTVETVNKYWFFSMKVQCCFYSMLLEFG